MVGKLWRAFASLLTFAGISRGAEQAWPALPNKGFISGRAATAKDVAGGNAVFVAARNGVTIGIPIGVTIPQYAHLSGEGGTVTRVIVVQAEAANGIKLFGVRDLQGKEYVVKDTDLRLFGTKPPN
jgi:hypothetical protein